MPQLLTRVLQLLKPVCLEPVLCNKRSHRNDKPARHNYRKPARSNEDPMQPNK